MKKYITNLYGQSSHSTAMIAQNMFAEIAKKNNYDEIAIGAYSVSSDTENEKIKRIEGMLSSLDSNSLVIAQMPSWNGIAFDEVFLRMVRKKAEKLVVFVHDFVPLMFANNAYLFERYVEAYNMANLVILPSRKMEDKLREKGLTTPVIFQDIWDHVTSVELTDSCKFQRKLKFAGNINRFPFVKSWKSDLPLDVFSDGHILTEGFLNLKGWLSDEQLLKELNKGGFGLVWSENIENQYEREYSEMNASFKFSTYLAAGIPIIVNKGLSKQDFVDEYKLGVVVESLEEAVEYVKTIPEEEYQKVQNNVKSVSKLIREGFFTKKLLIDIDKYLYLEKAKHDNL